jgi:hypothetical protein
MFLNRKTRIHKGKKYEYYSIAESYKVNGVSKKRILANLPNLPASILSSIEA